MTDQKDDSSTTTHTRKRKRISATRAVVTKLSPQLNPFANQHAIHPNTVVEELARLYVQETMDHFERHNICRFCHTEITGIPFTIWTCRTSFLCEECVCTIFDKYRYEWQRRPPIDTLSSMEHVVPNQTVHHVTRNHPKCFICRNHSNSCRTIQPVVCDNVHQFLVGRAFEVIRKTDLSKPSNELTLADLEQFNRLRQSHSRTTIYTCPHCRKVSFSQTDLTKYIRHQLVCLFRPIRCPFKDCTKTFMLGTHFLWQDLSRDSYQRIMEVDTNDVRLAFEQHFLTDCEHKIICNFTNCKLHTQDSRCIRIHEGIAHMSLFLQSLPSMMSTSRDMQNTLKIWSEREMRAQIPADVRLCSNLEEDDSPNEEDDDADSTPTNQEVAQIIIHELQQIERLDHS